MTEGDDTGATEVEKYQHAWGAIREALEVPQWLGNEPLSVAFFLSINKP